MTIGVLQSTLFGDMFGTAAMRAAFGELAFIARCAEVEAALARAQARLGIVPADAAAAISKAAEQVIADPAGPAGRYLHWGATTQDIMDTAVVLQIREGLRLLEADLTAVRGHLADLARKYRDTPMA